jgi:hypothetical protein
MHQPRLQASQQQYSTRGGAVSGDHEDAESLEETIAHQKLEIVRLLNTVKTLSAENTKLVKVRCCKEVISYPVRADQPLGLLYVGSNARR